MSLFSSSPPVNKRDLIEGLMTGIAVLNCFDATTTEITAAQIAERLSISRAAARRFLITLAHIGYLQSNGRYYKPAPKMLTLGNAYTASSSLSAAVLPFLEQLTRTLQFSSNCAVLEGFEAVYVAGVNAARIMSNSFEPGTRLPAYTSSAGRVMLAALDNLALEQWLGGAKLHQFTAHTPTDKQRLLLDLKAIRTRQFELAENMFEIGLRGIAVPIYKRSGQLIGALSITMASSACSADEAVRNCLPALKQASSDLSQLLG